MNVDLTHLKPVAIEGALARAGDRQPAIECLVRGPGYVRANVGCAGTCGLHDLLGGWHDVVIWHSGHATCDCVATRGCCYHIAALLTAEGGVLPDAPEPEFATEQAEDGTWVYRCSRPGCDATAPTARQAAKHGRQHAVTEFGRVGQSAVVEETIARLVSVGQRLLESDDPPELVLARIRYNYAALATQVEYAHPKPPEPGTNRPLPDSNGPVPATTAPQRRISDAARERAAAMEV